MARRTTFYCIVIGHSLTSFVTQKTELLADEHVVAYLGLMEASQNEQEPSEAVNSTNEDDFS